MRILAALLTTSTPAFAHADRLPDPHGFEAYWIAAGIVAIALAGPIFFERQDVRARK